MCMKNIKRILLVSLLVPLMCILTACSLFQSPLSAYDIWLQEGNQGTEADFLNWLRGDPGTPGRDANLLYDLLEKTFKEEQKNPDSDYYNSPDTDFLKFVTEQFKGELGEPGGSVDLWSAANRAVQSAVTIKSFFSGGRSSRGAGIVYKKSNDEAFIITNYHVISTYESDQKKLITSTDIRVHQYGALFFNDWNDFDDLAARATFYGGVPAYDLAILRIGRNTGGIYNPQFLDGPVQEVKTPLRYDVTLGQQVIAVGNPLGEGISVTNGVVSVVSEDLVMSDLEDPSKYVSYRVLRTSAAINQGNSGGGLFDRDGYLVGIVNARTFTHGDLPVDNMGYAIPLDIVKRVAEHIITRKGAYDHPLLGIQISDSGWNFKVATASEVESKKRYEGEVYMVETVKIVDFTYSTHAAASPSATNGFMKDDILVSMTYEANYGLDRNPVHTITRLYQIREFLIDCYDVKAITFVVIRNGNEKAITLDMTKKHTSS